MIADIRLSVDFLQNIKVRKLKKRLGADGVLALIALWSYCAKNFPDGRLGEYSDDVEFIADWDGEDGALASALRELGFLDVCEDGTLELHDWTENNPYVADSRERGDTQRLNRLGGQNPTAARAARDLGLRGVTKEQYYAVRHTKNYDEAFLYLQNGRTVAPPSDESGTTVKPSCDENDELLTMVGRSSKDGSTPAPAPVPEPEPEPEPIPVPEPVGELKSINTRSRQESGTGADAPRAAVSDCPHEAIIALYHEILPMMPRVQVWNESRRSMLRTRWREDKARQCLDWWRRYFEIVAASDFLCGRCPPGKSGHAFMADLEWLIRPSNMPKVLEGKYANRKQDDVFEQAKRLGYDGIKRQAFGGDFGSLRDEFVDVDGEVLET